MSALLQYVQVGVPEAVAATWIPAVTALVAVIVGPIVTLYVARHQNSTALAVARQQIHAELVSASRQQWINALRDAVAEFLATALMVGVRRAETVQDEAVGEQSQRLARVALLRTKINLLVNPNEADHQRLTALIETATKAVLSIKAADDATASGFGDTQRQIIQVTQQVLKREWERVKSEGGVVAVARPQPRG